MTPGEVLICGTGQAGTVIWISGEVCSILLLNGDVWTGPVNQCRTPQNQEDLNSCPVDVPRLETKQSRRK